MIPCGHCGADLETGRGVVIRSTLSGALAHCRACDAPYANLEPPGTARTGEVWRMTLIDSERQRAAMNAQTGGADADPEKAKRDADAKAKAEAASPEAKKKAEADKAKREKEDADKAAAQKLADDKAAEVKEAERKQLLEDMKTVATNAVDQGLKRFEVADTGDAKGGKK